MLTCADMIEDRVRYNTLSPEEQERIFQYAITHKNQELLLSLSVNEDLVPSVRAKLLKTKNKEIIKNLINNDKISLEELYTKITKEKSTFMLLCYLNSMGYYTSKQNEKTAKKIYLELISKNKPSVTRALMRRPSMPLDIRKKLILDCDAKWSTLKKSEKDRILSGTHVSSRLYREVIESVNNLELVHQLLFATWGMLNAKDTVKTLDRLEIILTKEKLTNAKKAKLLRLLEKLVAGKHSLKVKKRILNISTLYIKTGKDFRAGVLASILQLKAQKLKLHRKESILVLGKFLKNLSTTYGVSASDIVLGLFTVRYYENVDFKAQRELSLRLSEYLDNIALLKKVIGELSHYDETDTWGSKKILSKSYINKHKKEIVDYIITSPDLIYSRRYILEDFTDMYGIDYSLFLENYTVDKLVPYAWLLGGVLLGQLSNLSDEEQTALNHIDLHQFTGTVNDLLNLVKLTTK